MNHTFFISMIRTSYDVARTYITFYFSDIIMSNSNIESSIFIGHVARITNIRWPVLQTFDTPVK